MSRIVATEQTGFEDHTLSDHTYGIASDPLIQFACVFSALIHDVDHTGVPNTQLIHENEDLALLYKLRSVAEQNSVDLSWKLLMDDKFVNLRQAIYRTPEEKQRFRQLVVNSVMATDILDKDLKALRNARWEKAFAEGGVAVGSEDSLKEATDRKATIVIEHLIQASDVSHTMQHWHVYRKWNERLFVEMYQAFTEGRADQNPAEFWYQGEIGFFDNYIIPLTKKLKDCGVFGVSSDEYLNYAIQNRDEWEQRGQSIVAEMTERLQATA
jgi:3'5'-cyclic nucleotide phosphodiesterase